METKKKRCGYFISMFYGPQNDKIKYVKINADNLVTGLTTISKTRDFNSEHDNEVTIALNNLLKVIHIADLNTLYSLQITIYRDNGILNRDILKEFSFSVIEPLYKETLDKGKEFILTEQGINRLYDDIYPTIADKGGNEYLIKEFNEVLLKVVRYIENMKLKMITDPDILVTIRYNYDGYIIGEYLNGSHLDRNIKQYSLESFVKYFMMNR